ncbi:MAG: hypothetical protein COA88_13570, partial [Kordia sp.]
MINYIIDEVTIKPKYGIAVKDNNSNSWLIGFSTLATLQSSGFETVSDALNSINDKGYKNITVYLKRTNGSSNCYVVNKNKKQIKEDLKTPDHTNMEVSENVAEAVAVNSVTAPTLHQQLPTKQPTMSIPNQQLSTGLMGYDANVLDMYSKSQQTTQFQTENQDQKSEIERLRKENVDYRFKVLGLENDLKLEVSKPKKLISDEVGKMGIPILGQLLDVLSAKKAVGLNAPAPQPQENYSEAKTNLLNTIKDELFTDGYCQLYIALINKGVTD